MSYSTQGSSNRQEYDCCKYAQDLQQSVDPLSYQLYFGAHESCSKCIDKKVWFKQNPEIVDIESDLQNRTRPLSDCDGYKYNPNCKTGPNCISTFAPNAPRILSPSLCPIVYNNIPIQTNPGYSVPNPQAICTGNNYRHPDDIKRYQQPYSLPGNIDTPENVYMFLNTCSNQPLYQGGYEKVNPYMASNISSYATQFGLGLPVPLPPGGLSLDTSYKTDNKNVSMENYNK